MKPSTNPSLSIIIATKGREQGLQKLFQSIKYLEYREQIQPEILVVNNADDGPPERRVRELVESLNGEIGNLQCLRDHDGIPPRPKCRGHNLAIHASRGSILAFIDDDVELTPGWLTATLEFFRTKPYVAMQGAILMPPSVRNDKEFLRIWNRYRTIPYIDYGDRMDEIYTLTGPNMAIRREIFDEIGLFDERLGPGASGMSEDVEFAQRIVKHRGRIGYEPKAVVYHEADWDRLTDAFFRKWHEQQGRSRLLYKNSSIFSIIPNLNRSLLSYGWYSLFFNERKKYRFLGRYYHYLAMLKKKLGISAQ